MWCLLSVRRPNNLQFTPLSDLECCGASLTWNQHRDLKWIAACVCHFCTSYGSYCELPLKTKPIHTSTSLISIISPQVYWIFWIRIQDKKEEIWLSPMTKAATPTEMSKGQSDKPNNATKSSIKQRLRSDIGRSVGVTTSTQLVWFNTIFFMNDILQQRIIDILTLLKERHDNEFDSLQTLIKS